MPLPTRGWAFLGALGISSGLCSAPALLPGEEDTATLIPGELQLTPASTGAACRDLQLPQATAQPLPCSCRATELIQKCVLWKAKAIQQV